MRFFWEKTDPKQWSNLDTDNRFKQERTIEVNQTAPKFSLLVNEP
jgi:hypothetical protein